jgi:hypothetical protein
VSENGRQVRGGDKHCVRRVCQPGESCVMCTLIYAAWWSPYSTVDNAFWRRSTTTATTTKYGTIAKYN